MSSICHVGIITCRWKYNRVVCFCMSRLDEDECRKLHGRSNQYICILHHYVYSYNEVCVCISASLFRKCAHSFPLCRTMAPQHARKLPVHDLLVSYDMHATCYLAHIYWSCAVRTQLHIDCNSCSEYMDKSADIMSNSMTHFGCSYIAVGKHFLVLSDQERVTFLETQICPFYSKSLPRKCLPVHAKF